RKALRSFCQVNTFPVLHAFVPNFESFCCFTIAQVLFLHGFHYQLLEFWCVFFVRYPFWHNKTPLLLFSIPYCLTNGVQFTFSIGSERLFSPIRTSGFFGYSPFAGTFPLGTLPKNRGKRPSTVLF